MFKEGTPILVTRQLHEAKRAGTHYDIRLVLGDKAYSWATRKTWPKFGEKGIAIYEQPVHTREYSLTKRIVVPPGFYGAGITTLLEVRRGIARNKENFKGKFIVEIPETDERFLFLKLRKQEKPGSVAWLLKSLPPKKIEQTESIEKTAMTNKYLIKIASDLAKAEQYEKNEKEEVKRYSKEERDADCPEMKTALKKVIPQEESHARIFDKVKEIEKKAKIEINPAHKGLLHKNMGVAQGKPLSIASLKAAEKIAGPAEKKRIIFAENARHWNHK